MVSFNDWEWVADEIFEIERLVGKMVADGGEVQDRTGVAAGTVLYKVLWKGFPPQTSLRGKARTTSPTPTRYSSVRRGWPRRDRPTCKHDM